MDATLPHTHSAEPGRQTSRLATSLRGDAMPCAIIALLVLATRGIWFGDPVADFDEQLYSFIGWRLSEGELPYSQWWDRKPFGLFAIFALAHGLLGPGALAYQLVAFVFALAAALLTYVLARRLVDRMAATVAAAIQTMLLCAYGSYSGQSEAFLAPLMLSMAWLLIDPGHPRFARRALWAMLIGGLALQIKYTVLPQCVFFGLWALWVLQRDGARPPRLAAQALLYAMIGLLPTLAVAALYAAAGEFDAFWFANFVSFFDRLPAPQGRWAPDHWIGTLPLAVLAAGGAYAALRMKRPAPFGVWGFFCLWALATLASVLLPGTVYLYYYAAMSAPAALVGLPLLDRHTPMRGIPGLLLATGFLALLSLPGRYGDARAQERAAETLAAAIRPHLSPGHCLWLWDGPTALYRLTGSCVPTRFVYPDHLNNALETPALGVDQTAEVARVLASRPGAIVTASRPMTLQNPQATALVEAALAADYRPAATATMHNRTLIAWVREDRASGRAGGPSTTGTAPPR